VGEIVALVAAEERDLAEEAVALIQVEYEPLPAVFDPVEAMQPEAPVLHEKPEMSGVRWFDAASFRFQTGGNVASVYHGEDGDVDVGFREADEIFEDVYTSPKIQHAHMEPHAAVVQWEPSGKLVVYSAIQNPSALRKELAEIFALPESQVRVIVSFVGGGYGGKSSARLEPPLAMLSRKAGRPVQWVLTREEVFFTAHALRAVVKIKTGVKRDGTLVARQVETVYDTGAYAHSGPTTTRNGGKTSGGPYRIPHQSLTSYCVYTNSPLTAPYRGFGVPQVCWAYEGQMDDIARRLGMDPLELRLKNLVQEGDTFISGDKLVSVGISDCLRQAAAAIGWQQGAEQKPRELSRRGVRGKGVAVMTKTTMTPSSSAAIVRLDADGSAMLLTSSVEIGQGTLTSLGQIVAEGIGLPVSRVSVSFPDTDVTPYDQSTSSSRTIFNMGNAALQAAGQIRQQLLELGSKALEAPLEDLEVQDGFVQVKGVPGRRLTIPELFQIGLGAPVGSLFGSYNFYNRGGIDPRTGKGKTSAFFFFAACAAEVEVDTETGKVRVERIVIASDVGKAINPRQCHLQNEGSMIMSLGSTLFEEMVFVEGQPINCTFLEYMPPSMEDHPRFQSILVETAHPDGPFGAKGMGESGVGPVEPAIGNAVANALGGARIKDLPLRPDRVLTAVQAGRGE